MNQRVKIIGIIPARMASTRFPGKPLEKINGIPMIGHVYYRSKMSNLMNDVYIATCDNEIAEYIEGVGGKAVMTSDKHERASDRSAEALTKVEKSLGYKVDIVVMIQGDEPMLMPEMTDEAVKLMLDDNSLDIVNIMAPIRSEIEHTDKNIVKVVVDNNNFAMYFSREPIPSPWKGLDNIKPFKQTGIILFKRDFLLRFNDMEQTPLEIAESVDMLRVLEHRYKVRMAPTQYDVYSVDTEQDRKKVESMLSTDDLIPRYPI